MTTDEIRSIADAAIAIRGRQPLAGALDVLDLVLGEHKGEAIPFVDELLAPPTPLGQLIAEAFDPDMTPAEWTAWAGESADLLLREALLGAWAQEVLPRFTARYRLSPA